MSETTEANPVHDWIAKSVAEHDVVLFMKGVPEQPQCGFSAVTVQILDHLGVDFVGVNVLQNDLRDFLDRFDATADRLDTTANRIDGNDKAEAPRPRIVPAAE